MKTKQEYRLGIGISAMLLIFVIISLVTLGVLSFLGARADQALTDQNIALTQGYYRASAEAQRELFVIDIELRALSTGQEIAEYAKTIGADYETGNLRFIVDAGGGRVLSVAVLMDEKNRIRKITQYSLENEVDWTPELPDYPIY